MTDLSRNTRNSTHSKKMQDEVNEFNSVNFGIGVSNSEQTFEASTSKKGGGGFGGCCCCCCCCCGGATDLEK